MEGVALLSSDHRCGFLVLTLCPDPGESRGHHAHQLGWLRLFGVLYQKPGVRADTAFIIP